MRSFVILAVLLHIVFSYVLPLKEGKPVDNDSYGVSASLHSRRTMLRKEIMEATFSASSSYDEREQKVAQLLIKMFPETDEYMHMMMPMAAKHFVYLTEPFVEIVSYESQMDSDVIDYLAPTIEQVKKMITEIIDDMEKEYALRTNRI